MSRDGETAALIAMAEVIAQLATEGGASGFSVSEIIDRLIARIRKDAETIKRMDEALARLIDHYGEKTITNVLVSADEQYPWIAQAMAARKRPSN